MLAWHRVTRISENSRQARVEERVEVMGGAERSPCLSKCDGIVTCGATPPPRTAGQIIKEKLFIHATLHPLRGSELIGLAVALNKTIFGSQPSWYDEHSEPRFGTNRKRSSVPEVSTKWRLPAFFFFKGENTR